ncbi:MAG: threonine/serine dehydratase [Planctomycetes bacterium]|nr:threonine/serine dehydratase [Planctomycetota bacterium]
MAARVERAATVLRGHVRHTPLLASPWLSAATGGEVRLKCENLQHTGSFKVRGATHALAQLSAEQRRAGVVAASSGNHGLGVAAAARQLGTSALVFVPETTPAKKRARILEAGAQVQVFGDDCVLTEQEARRVAAASGRAYVSPYNDLEVIAGQGTVAVELLAFWPQVEVVYVALGGGGLIAGMAAYAKSLLPQVEFVACSPLASPAMAECVRQGRIVDVPCAPTLSDSTAGGVEPGAITFDLCRQLVDRFVEVDEAAIAAAVVTALAEERQLLEGAAGVAIAGLLADPAGRGRRAAVLACGGNLSLDKLQGLLTS